MFQLSTPVFDPAGDIPSPLTCDGAGISPALEWTDPPEGTESFVLVVDDPAATRGTWGHWVICDSARDRSPSAPDRGAAGHPAVWRPAEGSTTSGGSAMWGPRRTTASLLFQGVCARDTRHTSRAPLEPPSISRGAATCWPQPNCSGGISAASPEDGAQPEQQDETRMRTNRTHTNSSEIVQGGKESGFRQRVRV